MRWYTDPVERWGVVFTVAGVLFRNAFTWPFLLLKVRARHFQDGYSEGTTTDGSVAEVSPALTSSSVPPHTTAVSVTSTKQRVTKVLGSRLLRMSVP